MGGDRVSFDQDGVLDEMVMSNAGVHLELLDMDWRGRKTYMLIVENGVEHVHLTVFAAKDVFVFERFNVE